LGIAALHKYSELVYRLTNQSNLGNLRSLPAYARALATVQTPVSAKSQSLNRVAIPNRRRHEARFILSSQLDVGENKTRKGREEERIP
jgi:hypothetical protein